MRIFYCYFSVITLLLPLFLSGCMTADRAVEQTDKLAPALVDKAYEGVLTNAAPFSISQPSQLLMLRWAAQAEKQDPDELSNLLQKISERNVSVVSNQVIVTITDALSIGARNDRSYQNYKESIFKKALDLDDEMHFFEISWNGFLSGSTRGDFWETRAKEGGAGGGFSTKFSQGAKLTASVVANVVKLLHGDWTSSLMADLTLTVPLLRGSGRDVVQEPMRQAERNLIDAVRTFERYRQTYSLSVIESYLNVLAYAQILKNTQANHLRLGENQERAKNLFEAGRMDRVQFDQANQDYLSAGQSVIEAQNTYKAQLDSFRCVLGLPPEIMLDVQSKILPELSSFLESQVTKELPAIDELKLFQTACTNRVDFHIKRDAVFDAERKLNVAKDALGADLNLTIGASSSKVRHGDKTDLWDAQLRSDLPWDRNAERNEYRSALINLDRARRDLSDFEDNLRKTIRADVRNLDVARKSFQIQQQAVALAQRRIDSNELFMKAGRSQMRDVLEAESAYLTAQNALLSAVIRFQMRTLTLRSNLSTFTINADGTFDWMEMFE